MLRRKKTVKSVKAGEDNAGLSQAEPAGLAGQLAHEIKNPLSTIKINLKLISEDLEGLRQLQRDGLHGSLGIDENKLTGAIRKTAIVRKETDRLEQILDGFLRYTDKIQIAAVCVNINEMVSDLIDFYAPRAYSQSIIIRQGLTKEALFCKIDPDLMKQALLNIFINAQQAMEKGGELLIRTSRYQKYAIIQISDTGSGIEPERLNKIFEAYYSTKPGGRGLGLPIAKKIIQAHNGAINIESESGKGTLVTIKLPLKNSAEKQQDFGDEQGKCNSGC
jgi:signal transduction histidine kinase